MLPGLPDFGADWGDAKILQKFSFSLLIICIIEKG